MTRRFARYKAASLMFRTFDNLSRRSVWALSRCGAILLGYDAPRQGDRIVSSAKNISDLAEYEQYRHRLEADPFGHANFEFVRNERFIRR